MRRLLLFSAGFAAAALLFVYAAAVPWVWAILAAAVLLAVVLLRGKNRRRVLIGLLGLLVGAAWCVLYEAVFLSPLSAMTGEERPFTAVALGEPAATRYGWRLDADLLVGKRRVRTVLYYSEGGEDAAPGDRLYGNAVFSETLQEKDPYLLANDVFLIGKVKKALQVYHTEKPGLRELPARVSVRIRENLRKIIPADCFGFFSALVTGDRSDLPFEVSNEMILAGIYHSVSLSGMHVSVLAGLLLLLFRRRWLTAAVSVPVLLGFVLMTGAMPSTVRASVMQLLLLFAPLAGREYDAPTALFAALLLLLVQNPWAAAHWGLQLSFLSTLGILVFLPPIAERTVRLPRFLRGLVSALALTFCASAFSLPLAAAYFGVTSLLAPLCNLLALWAVTVCFVGGLFTAALSFLWLSGAAFFAGLLAWVCRWVLLVVRAAAAVPFCAVYAETPLLCVWAVLAYLLILTAMLLRARPVYPASAILLTLAAALLLTYLPMRSTHRFTVLDVGQGQCLILRSGRSAVMIDCGANGDETGELAARYLLSYGVRSLDALILTHFDSDHTDGIPQLLRRVGVKTLWYPDGAEKTAAMLKTLAAGEKAGVVCTAVSQTAHAACGSAAVTVFPPMQGGEENDRGLSLLISASECDILVTGDMDTQTETRLLTQAFLPDLEILVAGHHGSKYSTGDALLEALLPETVLISAGIDNPYGHPAQETLDRIAGSGAAAYCTAENGTLTIGW